MKYVLLLLTLVSLNAMGQELLGKPTTVVQTQIKTKLQSDAAAKNKAALKADKNKVTKPKPVVVKKPNFKSNLYLIDSSSVRKIYRADMKSGKINQCVVMFNTAAYQKSFMAKVAKRLKLVSVNSYKGTWSKGVDVYAIYYPKFSDAKFGAVIFQLKQ